jgi:hypothetical protein
MRCAVLVVLVAMLAACGRSEPTPGLSGNVVDPHLQLQNEMEHGAMDFSRVTIVRLQRDGKRLEVASVMPTVVAQTTLAGNEAKTIFRVNDRGDALVLFSRDVPNGRSYKTELSFSKLAPNQSFAFPVVQPDGKLTEYTFTVEKIISPPQ